MNLGDYELYIKETKCEHGVKAAVVLRLDHDYKYSAIYDCDSNCAKFYLYPNLYPTTQHEEHVSSGVRKHS